MHQKKKNEVMVDVVNVMMSKDTRSVDMDGWVFQVRNCACVHVCKQHPHVSEVMPDVTEYFCTCPGVKDLHQAQ